MTHPRIYSSVGCVVKPRLLLVSYSESETAFLCRIAKSLMLTGKWGYSFLLFYEAEIGNNLRAELKSLGLENFSTSECEVNYKHKEEKSVTPIQSSYLCLLQWWREKKKEQPYLMHFLPLIRAVLWVIWIVVRLIPWLFRYKIKLNLRNGYKKLKETIRSKYPTIYKLLRKYIFIIQSFWYEFAWVSDYYFNAKKMSEVSRLTKLLESADKLIASQAPDVLILAKDSAYYSTTVFVQAARRLGVPSVVIPYDRADTETLAKDRLGHPDHVIRSRASRKVSAKFPAWVYTHEKQSLLLATPAMVVALEELGLAPQNPWGYNNSLCDKILLETEDDRRSLLMSGATPHQLEVVGAPYMDFLDELLSKRNWIRAKLCNDFGFNPEKPFVVASVSPNKISQRGDDCEFKSYHTLIERWSTALVRCLDCNLIYSLHPLTKHNEVRFIEDKGGKILNLPLEELIAASDLYVVDSSSTTRWALYAGVNVIDYDFYRYNLGFNSRLDGVNHITSYEEFVVALIGANSKLKKLTNENIVIERNVERSFGSRLSLELDSLLVGGKPIHKDQGNEKK